MEKNEQKKYKEYPIRTHKGKNDVYDEFRIYAISGRLNTYQFNDKHQYGKKKLLDLFNKCFSISYISITDENNFKVRFANKMLGHYYHNLAVRIYVIENGKWYSARGTKFSIISNTYPANIKGRDKLFYWAYKKHCKKYGIPIVNEDNNGRWQYYGQLIKSQYGKSHREYRIRLVIKCVVTDSECMTRKKRHVWQIQKFINGKYVQLDSNVKGHRTYKHRESKTKLFRSLWKKGVYSPVVLMNVMNLQLRTIKRYISKIKKEDSK